MNTIATLKVYYKQKNFDSICQYLNEKIHGVNINILLTYN